MKYKFFVSDWAPNGTQALIVRNAKTFKQVDYRDEVLFGVDVAKLSAAKYFDGYAEYAEYRIPQRLIKKHVASGPFGVGFDDNCKWLSKYLRGGK